MIVDVTEATFQAEVIDRSHETPVVVDFWADWCRPCHQLAPFLEKAAASREGDVILAKVDTEANPRLSQAFQIQGIPAVKAFKDGKVVDEFTGVRPPVQVERFFDAIVPSEADRLAAAGDEESLRRALELQPNRADAGVALAELLLARGDRTEAATVLARIPGSFRADGMAARIRLEDGGSDDLSGAFAKLDSGATEPALNDLIGAIAAATDTDHKEELRRIVVGELDKLGVEHPVARESRRQLAKALF